MQFCWFAQRPLGLVVEWREGNLLSLVAACSHSPALYRPRARWAHIYKELVGAVPQPTSAAAEDADRLDEYARRHAVAFSALSNAIIGAKPAAVVVLSTDRGTVFDCSNTPQLHVYVGDDIWGATADPSFDPPEDLGQKTRIRCHRAIGAQLADELAYAGFDISESRGGFRPADPERGLGAGFLDPIRILLAEHDIPVVPVFLNCSVAPVIRGTRVAEFGRELGRIAAEADDRIVILASGGMSGDPRGYLAGRVDEVLDRWVMQRLSMGRSRDMFQIWDVDSLTVRGATAEIRLWLAAGAAAEGSGLCGRVLDYMPFHHGAVGAGFMQWGPRQFRPER